MARASKFYIRVDDNHLGQFEERGLDAAADAAFRACQIGCEVARSKAPKDTGKLAGGLSVGKAKGGRGRVKGGATIEANVPYAVFQEFGTRRGVDGTHFIRQGISAAQRAWPKLVEAQL